MFRALYDWVLRMAHHRHALRSLAIVSFAESSFFPIPPDAMLVPMVLARRDQAYRIAAVCTIASIVGGIFGYAIGYYLWDSLGQWLVNLYHMETKVEALRQGYAHYGAAIILLKGLTPIPFKLVTITSGFANYNIWMFIGLSLIARGGRFFLVAVLLNRYGVWIRSTIEKHLGLWVALAVGVLVLGFIIAALLRRYGEPVQAFIEKRLNLFAWGFLILLVGGFAALAYI